MVDNIKVSKGNFIQFKKGMIDKDYTIGDVVGSGAFATVRKVYSKANGQMRALKIIKKQRGQDTARMYLEVEILKKLIHPNIMQIFEFYEDKKNFYIITEFCDGGELFDKIVEKGQLSEADAANIMKQLLSAVSYIHSNQIVHRDLKPENILIDENFNIELCDFGVFKALSLDKTISETLNQFYTVRYSPPEVLKNSHFICKASDIWSLGLVLYDIYYEQQPWFGLTGEEIIEAIKKERPFTVKKSENVPSQITTIIKMCTNYEYAQRPKVADILKEVINMIYELKLV